MAQMSTVTHISVIVSINSYRLISIQTSTSRERETLMDGNSELDAPQVITDVF